WGFDFVLRYKHQPMPPAGAAMTVEELCKAGHLLDERGWLNVHRRACCLLSFR
ncbi:hypothetical protein GGX14DRAFT_369275, partial [Mycena pura]